MVRAIGADETMHADFGSGLYEGAKIGIPFVTVGQVAGEGSGELRVRRRVGPRAVPDPPRRADRGRPRLGRRPARDRGRPRSLPPVRALRGVSARRRRPLDGRLGRDLEPELEQDAARRLDVGRRGGAGDPAGARALGRGQARPDQARASVHRPGNPARIHLPRAPLRIRLERPGPAGHGTALQAEGELSDRRFPAPGSDRSEGAQALRHDRLRQRLAVVRHRYAEPALGQRRSPHARRRARPRVRGGRYEQAAAAYIP